MVLNGKNFSGINLSLQAENQTIESNSGIKEEIFGSNQMNSCFPCPPIRLPTNNCSNISNMQPGKSDPIILKFIASKKKFFFLLKFPAIFTSCCAVFFFK